MQTTSTSAPVAHTFSPADWLANFEKVGGCHVLTDEAIHLGFTVYNRSEDQRSQARQMLDTLGEPERSHIANFLRKLESDRLTELLGPDAAVQAAWARRKAAYARYLALPIERPNDPIDRSSYMTPDERECWAVIDAAEQTIESTVATTPQAVAIQLWIALYHSVTGREEDAAITSGDIERVAALGDALDWDSKMIVAAIKSLQAMEADNG